MYIKLFTSFPKVVLYFSYYNNVRYNFNLHSLGNLIVTKNIIDFKY